MGLARQLSANVDMQRLGAGYVTPPSGGSLQFSRYNHCTSPTVSVDAVHSVTVWLNEVRDEVHVAWPVEDDLETL